MAQSNQSVAPTMCTATAATDAVPTPSTTKKKKNGVGEAGKSNDAKKEKKDWTDFHKKNKEKKAKKDVSATTDAEAKTAEKAALLALQHQAAENKALREQVAAMQMMEASRAESREDLERRAAADRQARQQSEQNAREVAAEKAAVEHQAATNQREQQAALRALAQKAAAEKAALERQAAADLQSLAQKVAADKIRRKKAEQAAQIAADARLAEQLQQRSKMCGNCGRHYSEQDNDSKACVQKGPEAINYHHAREWQSNYLSADKYPCCQSKQRHSKGCTIIRTPGPPQFSKHYPVDPTRPTRPAPPRTKINFQVGQTTYDVDLLAMAQKNRDTGFERKIRKGSSQVWEYEDDGPGSGNWQQYDSTMSARIDRVYACMKAASSTGAVGPALALEPPKDWVVVQYREMPAPSTGQAPSLWQSMGTNDGKAKDFAVRSRSSAYSSACLCRAHMCC